MREHMDSENRHEFDATIDTFDHPRYEIIPTGDVHDGEFLGRPPTGKAFRCPMTAFFFFEGDRIVCERVYFDAGTILGQIS